MNTRSRHYPLRSACYNTAIYMLCGIMWCIATISPAQAAQQIQLCGGDGTITHVCAQALQEAYKRLGIKLSYKAYPPERALHLSNSGKCDGEIARIDSITKRYANLRKVNVPIFMLEGIAYTSGQQLPITGWKSLRNYRVGARYGIKFSEQDVLGLKISYFHSIEELFRLLTLNKIDIAVVDSLNGALTIRNMRLTGITANTPPVTQVPLFHYLHQTHTTLIPKIEKELARMKQSGEIDKIIRKAQKRLLEKQTQNNSSSDQQ